MTRRDDRNTRSPILRDSIRGSGGLGSGWFTTNGTEGQGTYDATSILLATEALDPIVTELGDVGITT